MSGGPIRAVDLCIVNPPLDVYDFYDGFSVCACMHACMLIIIMQTLPVLYITACIYPSIVYPRHNYYGILYTSYSKYPISDLNWLGSNASVQRCNLPCSTEHHATSHDVY